MKLTTIFIILNVTKAAFENIIQVLSPYPCLTCLDEQQNGAVYRGTAYLLKPGSSQIYIHRHQMMFLYSSNIFCNFLIDITK